MYEIIREKEVLDRLSKNINNGIPVFRPTSLEIPVLLPAELGLLRAVSWFYVHYNEVGKVNVRFLLNYLPTYGLDESEKFSEHFKFVVHLRTYFQHNLDPTKNRSINIKKLCESWFLAHSGTSVPTKESEWQSCLEGFLGEVGEFFAVLSDCLRRIEEDEFKDTILESWSNKRNRYHPPESFDNLIHEIINDMGRLSMDVVKLRKSFYDEWTRELDTLHGEYDFDVEARKLIEYTILTKPYAVLPITGRDLLDEFDGLEAGPLVGELLKEARRIYDQKPCSREELLSKLLDSYGQELNIKAA